MKRWSSVFLLGLLTMAGCAQKNDGLKTSANTNTLLWKISGKGLSKPSYLFGTIHMLCEEDAVLSDNMKKAIKAADEVYLEIDLDNLMEMFGAMAKMKMTGDTTLQDLLSPEDYTLVKEYFESRSSMIPFSMLESFKPILAASTLEQSKLPCDNMAAMDQIVMQEAKDNDKEVKGLETMSYQAGMLDSIPYKMQAEQLVSYVKNNGKSDDGTEMKDMLKAYNDQDLQKLEEMMTKADAGMSGFTELLLYNRNRNWVKKLNDLLPNKALVIAVGAGHLPGEQGVINLLRKEGYTVEPVENKLNKTKEI